ncbi:MAG: hypothetical protein VYD57_09460 [Pseudomonadota bacterium]|nr:hypothetical protein [Pseudomonadota bacterium]
MKNYIPPDRINLSSALIEATAAWRASDLQEFDVDMQELEAVVFYRQASLKKQYKNPRAKSPFIYCSSLPFSATEEMACRLTDSLNAIRTKAPSLLEIIEDERARFRDALVMGEIRSFFIDQFEIPVRATTWRTDVVGKLAIDVGWAEMSGGWSVQPGPVYFDRETFFAWLPPAGKTPSKNPSPAALVDFLKEAADGTKSETMLREAAKEKFAPLGLKIADNQTWRNAWKQIPPELRLKQGQKAKK